MAESSRHDPANSNTVTQQEYEDMNAPHQPSGVIGAVGDTSIVYADGTARAVKIRANKRAKVRGRTWYNDAVEAQLTIAPNTAGAGLTRIDTVVLRLYRASQGAAPAPQAWQVRLAVVQGVASATPVAPAVTQQTTSGNTFWDLPLADVAVGNGVAVINAGNVTSREWYVTSGPLVSASTVTPPTGFPIGQQWLHTDTLLMNEWDGATWRRLDWSTSWGVIGGKRWTTGGALANGVGAAEGGTNTDTGVVTLIPGRSYSFPVKLSCGFTDASANFFDFRIRRGSVTGPQVGDHIHSDNQSTFGRDVEFNVDVPDIGAAAITDTYYLTVQRVGGTGVANISRGTATNATYFYLVDKGPISRITVA